VEYREGVFVGYRHYDRAGTPVAFPFGHGLSYTTFNWSAVRAEVRGDRVAVTLTVTNVGERAGSEVVQVYVHDVESTVERAPHELRGFTKVTLEPGRSAPVRIELDRRAFAVWDPGTHGWVVEGGEFELRVAPASRDVRATLRIDLDGDGVTPAPSPLPEASTPPGPYTVDTPMGDLDRPVPRLVLRLLTAIARRVVRDTPMAGTIDQLLAGTPPRMLPMVTDGRLKPGFARWLVRRANRGAPS
jgi:beta-glucosidase